ncbi:MAG: CNP1-like family protein [Burkholderiales bacterium]
MRAWPALLLVLPLAACAQTPGSGANYGDRDRRGEIQVAFPQYPKPENYLPFEVSTITPFVFYVDAKSLSVGADAVVRYSVIAKSSDGALNISFEGMRCAEREFRIYAFGRADHTWSEARNSRWEAIRSDPRNAQRAVLYSDYFCPVTGNIATAEQGVRVLKSGGNPRATRPGY